jgi:hypothetical protein
MTSISHAKANPITLHYQSAALNEKGCGFSASSVQSFGLPALLSISST